MDPKNNGGDNGQVATIELPLAQESKEETPKLTVADISDGSFTKDEIEAAKRHGLVTDESEQKKDAAKVEEKKADDTAEKKEPVRTEEGKEDPRDAFALDADKEKQFQEIFGENQTVHSIYRKGKRARVRAQEAEAERDHVLIQKKAIEQERDELKRKLEAVERAPRRGEDDLDLPDPDNKPAEEGEDKPLTRADLDRIKQEEEEAAKSKEATNRKHLERINERLDDFQDDAKLRYKDFDQVMDLTADLMKNLGTLYPEPREQQRIQAKIDGFIQAAANADKFDVDGFNPADMAYEVGRLHPKYNRGGSREKADEGADLTPDKLNRIVNNASRRTSASINGGASKRMVSVEDLTAKDLAALPADKFRELRKTHPHVVERLLRQ